MGRGRRNLSWWLALACWPLLLASAAQAKDHCALPANVGLVFWSPGYSLAPGQTAAINAYWTDHPSHFEPISADCLDGVAVTPSAIATVLPGLRQLRIAPDAPDGAVVELHAKAGDRLISSSARIVVAASHPLAGTWHEDRAELCQTSRDAGVTPVGELVFDADGRFSLTWEPFESRTDYRGAYRFDPARGTLTFVPDAERPVPAVARLSGAAKIDARGKLILTDIDFGAPIGRPARPPGCSLVFSR